MYTYSCIIKYKYPYYLNRNVNSNKSATDVDVEILCFYISAAQIILRRHLEERHKNLKFYILLKFYIFLNFTF